MAVSGVYCNVTMNSVEGDISNKQFSSESVCECSPFENVPVFPWDDGELLLFTSTSLCGGELLFF